MLIADFLCEHSPTDFKVWLNVETGAYVVCQPGLHHVEDVLAHPEKYGLDKTEALTMWGGFSPWDNQLFEGMMARGWVRMMLRTPRSDYLRVDITVTAANVEQARAALRYMLEKRPEMATCLIDILQNSTIVLHAEIGDERALHRFVDRGILPRKNIRRREG